VFDDIADGGRQGRRRVDDQQRVTLLAQLRHAERQLVHRGVKIVRRGRGAQVPPVRQAALRVGVQQGNRPVALPFGLDRQMSR
jgi:hypothetical protein